MYLVRTPTPVYNTTHHVLKRIAVANESMLNEVRKEVDIMVCPYSFLPSQILTTSQRILKGHPNIVYLIDAAWHQDFYGNIFQPGAVMVLIDRYAV